MSRFSISPNGFSITLANGTFVLVQFRGVSSAAAEVSIVTCDENKATVYEADPDTFAELLFKSSCSPLGETKC